MDPSSLTSHPSTAAQAKTVSLCDVYVSNLINILFSSSDPVLCPIPTAET